MAIKLPSEADAWIREWGNKLNESEEYSEAAAGWGVGFNGDFLFEIQPDAEYDGDPVTLFVALEDGSCTDAYEADDPESEDWGFAFRGSASDWKRLVQGEIDPVEGLMNGQFDLDGDMQKVLQYSRGAVVMTENAGKVDTEFEF